MINAEKHAILRCNSSGLFKAVTLRCDESTLDSIGSTNENSLAVKDVHADWLRQIEPKKLNMV